ncbi:hypothetical protein LZQ00_11035 [Sphingobacterium sp. SRCM116780]|uniref:hypothetical protein n=1 Tax=Sphingobacterium sp. SRCM116780 TaxID=2907623 RepID=UPI001F27D53E|nr:hypothetical protein [Sphingobacterium sp. SRCM116780]UIR54811.1 hypothetical protein LZQ00_11035 [Sphingobacterium sp. SRCM116780]
MENEKINMDARILQYNLHYGFMENPKMFKFEDHPHRLIVRNYALRNKDKEVYEKYLLDFFPDRATKELKQFDEDLQHLKYMDREEGIKWLVKQNVKVLQSDIHGEDPDAVFSMIHISQKDDVQLIDNEGFILNNVEADKLLKTHDHIWLDTQVRSSRHIV